eukprot:TRINITY_DN23824_c1_g2_i3.p2 TRINITY_DN23824_c1_g2~~TRINITY_DN23824_c1_g2_i3.p2  ORF type:complete len:131 (+),score=10.31 TRINITY_DN23824_c1_g2_i3:178-570(+)
MLSANEVVSRIGSFLPSHEFCSHFILATFVQAPRIVFLVNPTKGAVNFLFSNPDEIGLMIVFEGSTTQQTDHAAIANDRPMTSCITNALGISAAVKPCSSNQARMRPAMIASYAACNQQTSFNLTKALQF